MLGIDEVIEGVVGGTVWGIGLVAAAGIAVVLGPRAKPLVKQAIKGYLVTTERAREMVAEAGEQVQDLWAEAKYEYDSQLAADATPEASPPTRRRTAASHSEEQPA
jgi:hypothetical protein